MSRIELPEPISLENKCKNYKDAIKFVYEQHMSNSFFNKSKRPKLRGKFIYVDTKKENLINGLPSMYWHLVTFEDGTKYTIDPCLDLTDRAFCKTSKSKCKTKLYIPKNNNYLKDRSECIYRLRRVNRINPIIEMANKYDDRIKVWRKEPKPDYRYERVFIRFEEGIYDHIVILLDWGKMYNFITSYPVSHRLTKEGFDKDYENYILKSKCII